MRRQVQQEWLQLNLELHLEPCGDRKKLRKSKQLERQTVKEDTTSIQLSLFDQANDPLSYTLELVRTLKSLTLKDRLSFLMLAEPIVKLSQTLEADSTNADSTNEERDYKPYWNDFCQVMSGLLLSQVKTDCTDSVSTLSHGEQAGAKVRFWFSTITHLARNSKWFQTSLQLSTSDAVGSSLRESTSKESKRTLTYRVYPKGETLKIWLLRIHANRKVYNNAIAYLNKHQKFRYISKKGKVITSGKKGFRSFCKTLGTEIIPQWCQDLQIAHALDNALFEAYKAWKDTDRQPKYIVKGFEKIPNPLAGLKIAKFRSIRDQKQTIQFDPLDYKDGHWMASKGLEKAEFWGEDYCLINYNKATELTYNKGRWYAHFTVDMPIVPLRNQGKLIALDPGLRCFMTAFDGENFHEFARGDFQKIAKLCCHLDKLKSLHDKSKGYKFNRYRYKLRLAMERIRTRIKNLRQECHKQIASYLARNYDVIYLPTFETSQMVVNKKRKLKNKSARAMMTWAFYEFSKTLQHLCNRYGSRLIRVTEEYTSRTCTSCGKIHHKLGGQKTFICPHCGHSLPRDFNGAFGIFLKALWDTTFVRTVDSNEVVFELDSNVQFCSN